MGLFEDFFDELFGDDDDDDWGETTIKSNWLGGRHRFIVNYIAQNGMECGTEVIAFTSGQARDCVKCRSDVKYVTSCYEL